MKKKVTNSLQSYIVESAKKKRDYYIRPDIPVILKDRFLSDEVDIEEFIETIENTIPIHLLRNVEIIYIGDFPHLEGRNALYSDGAIYISSQEPTTHDLLEDAIHEIAHCAEEKYGSMIYNDGLLEKEFLGKRRRLKSILDAAGYTTPEKYYSNVEYSKKFDEFLSEEVGYPTLLSLTMGLFASPYGATSLREYFANGFEKYFLGEAQHVKEVSPMLYNILNTVYKESDV
tara:strand:+ start:4405 stop:5094 length:690 start_codon:yes stop_codon:yes gene_type:complete